VFPNPVSDLITVQSTSASSTEPVNMDIYNSIGKLVASFSLTGAISSVPVADLATGNYLIRFYNSKLNSSKAFIKM